MNSVTVKMDFVSVIVHLAKSVGKYRQIVYLGCHGWLQDLSMCMLACEVSVSN